MEQSETVHPDVLVEYNHVLRSTMHLIQRFVSPADAKPDQALFVYRTCTDMAALLELSLVQDIESLGRMIQTSRVEDDHPDAGIWATCSN